MSTRPCGLCGKQLRDQEAVTLWCGRHWWPGGDEQYDGDPFGYAIHEQYVAVLCHACAEQHWPPLQDAVKGLAWSVPPRSDQAATHFPVGAEQDAPRRRPDDDER